MQIAAERPGWQWNIRSRLDALIARPMPLFVAIFIVFLFVYAVSIFFVPKRYGRLIVGDGIYYYVYVRSAVLDGDLNFQNDYEIYQSYNNEDLVKKQEMLNRKTPIGMAANLFSVGPAILWSPIFLLTHFIASVLGQAGDGYALWDEAPVMFLSIVYGFVGIVLVYRVVAEMFSKFAAFVAILGIWLATNVVYYMGISPSASHVLSMFASALFLYCWWRPHHFDASSQRFAEQHPRLDASPLLAGEGAKGTRKKVDWFVWGLSAGLMALVRWQDILIALLALFEWIAVANGERRTANGNLLSAITKGALFLLGLLLAFIPQMFAWQVLYGSPLTVPQGGGFFQFLHPEMLNVWFSTKRGLFSWTPLLVFSVIGFVPLYKKNRMLGAATLLIFFAETYVNSIVNDWWGGEAFGARRFISLMPFFALGLAALIDAAAHRVALRERVSQTAMLVALVAFIVWNNLFVLQYSLWLHGIGHISAIPTLQEMTIDKFTAPFQALGKLRSK